MRIRLGRVQCIPPLSHFSAVDKSLSDRQGIRAPRSPRRSPSRTSWARSARRAGRTGTARWRGRCPTAWRRPRTSRACTRRRSCCSPPPSTPQVNTRVGLHRGWLVRRCLLRATPQVGSDACMDSSWPTGCSSGLIMFSLIYRHAMRCYTSGLPSCIVGGLNPVTRKCNAVCVALNWSNATLFAWP
jgi:hypothetical protein